MKAILLALIIFTLCQCAQFDIAPTAIFDPETGQWIFGADIIPTPQK